MSQPHQQHCGPATRRARTVVESDCVQRSGHHVLSTPSVLQLIEETAMDALAAHLRPDQSSVGSRAEIVHLRPTLVDRDVAATVWIREIDRRRYLFDVEVRDDLEVVAYGTHERFIVDADAFAAKLADKQRQSVGARSANTP